MKIANIIGESCKRMIYSTRILNSIRIFISIKILGSERVSSSNRTVSLSKNPGSARILRIVLLFSLVILALTKSSSSFVCSLEPLLKINNSLSFKVGKAELASYENFWLRLTCSDEMAPFSFKINSNNNIEKEQAQVPSEYPGNFKHNLCQIILLGHNRPIYEYPETYDCTAAFESQPGEKKALFLALRLKKIDEALEASEILKEGQKEAKKNETEGKEEIIKPEFKNIKEKISVYAFLAWLWLVIGVLLYILNEQIKEAERRRQLGL